MTTTSTTNRKDSPCQSCSFDTETLGLGINDPIWEIAAIRRESDGTENRYHFHVSDAEGRRLTPPDGFPDRFRADFDARYGKAPMGSRLDLAPLLRDLFRDRPHIVGAVPNFDTERIAHQFGVDGWHYHLIDVENLAVGYLAGRGEPLPPLPWNSDDLSRAVGVTPTGSAATRRWPMRSGRARSTTA